MRRYRRPRLDIFRGPKQLIASLVTLVVLAVVLIACAQPVGTSNQANPDGDAGLFRVAEVTVHGQQVLCVTWKDDNVGGLSCDWSRAH